jgi:hypothetical protein
MQGKYLFELSNFHDPDKKKSTAITTKSTTVTLMYQCQFQLVHISGQVQCWHLWWSYL